MITDADFLRAFSTLQSCVELILKTSVLQTDILNKLVVEFCKMEVAVERMELQQARITQLLATPNAEEEAAN